MSEVSLLDRIDDLDRTFEWLGKESDALNQELENIDIDSLSFSKENRNKVNKLKSRIDEIQKRYKVNAILYNNLLKEVKEHYIDIDGIDFIDGIFDPL